MRTSAEQNQLTQQLIAAMQRHTGGDLAGAKQQYQQIATEFGNPPQALMLLAQVHIQLHEISAALDTLVMLLQKNGDHNDALKRVYELCLHHPDKEKIAALMNALPASRGIKRVAARLYQDWQRYDQQLAVLEALYQSGERSEIFYDDYVRCLKNNQLPDRFLAVANEALAAYPQSLALLKLRANAHFWLGNHRAALADGEKILALDPADHYVRTTVGSLKMMLTNFTEGLSEYAAHEEYEITRLGFTIPPTLPKWPGDPLQEKKLLVWTSQGIGDIVMFAGFIPWVATQGAARITFAVPKKSVPLFARSFPGISVVALDTAMLKNPSGEFDLHIPAGELMLLALPDKKYLPADHPPYLKPDPALTHALRQKYQMLAPGKKLVGISWHTTNADTFSRRNIPLAEWKCFFELPHIQLVSLQYGDHAAEIAAINRQYPNAILADDAVDAFGDTDQSAAQIAAMDKVVSIQNSTVHLAGAMGIPTTILLSAASEWRWGLGISTNRWYKSVYVERQQTLYDWNIPTVNTCKRLVP